MKKLIILLLLLPFLSACQHKPSKINEADQLDLLIEKAIIAYDLRDLEECEKGHIKGFVCIGYGSDIKPKEQAIFNITNKYSQYKKNDIIILISNNSDDSQYVAEYLSKKGFRKVYYFMGGYNEYVKQKGDSFTPEVGCGC